MPRRKKAVVDGDASHVARPLWRQAETSAKKLRLENDVVKESADAPQIAIKASSTWPGCPRVQPSTADANTSAVNRSADSEAAVAKSSDHSRRSQDIRAALSMKKLRNHAAAGDESSFRSELCRVAVLDDVKTLLLTAASGDDKVGAVGVTNLILERPESGDLLNEAIGPNGRTLVHMAILSDRLDMCCMLLERKADLQVRDSAGQTPFDLAKARKLDASAGRLEDPFVRLLRESTSGGTKSDNHPT